MHSSSVLASDISVKQATKLQCLCVDQYIPISYNPWKSVIMEYWFRKRIETFTVF